MDNQTEIIRAEMPEVASLIRHECWIEGERRGHAVDQRLTFFKVGAGAGVGATVAAFGSAAFFFWWKRSRLPHGHRFRLGENERAFALCSVALGECAPFRFAAWRSGCVRALSRPLHRKCFTTKIIQPFAAGVWALPVSGGSCGSVVPCFFARRAKDRRGRVQARRRA